MDGGILEQTDRDQPGDADADACRRQHRLCTLGRTNRPLHRRRRSWAGARCRHRAASLPDPAGMQSAIRARRGTCRRTLQVDLPDLGARPRRSGRAQQTCPGPGRRCADDFAALPGRPRRGRRVARVLRGHRCRGRDRHHRLQHPANYRHRHFSRPVQTPEPARALQLHQGQRRRP